MLQLQEAIKKIIERFIVNITPFTSSVSNGNKTIPIKSTRRYQEGDEIAIYNTEVLNTTGEGEIRTIETACDGIITISEALIDNYPQSTSFVQKLVGNRFLEAIHLGNPGKYTHFPAISIDAKDKSNEWLTLESTSEEFSIDITVYVEASDYEKSYRLMHTYIKKIETALFRSLYPLVEPYDCATIAQDIKETDTIVRITNPNDLVFEQVGQIWLESSDYLRSNSIKTLLDAGVFELSSAASRPFSAGDKIIRPRRHFFNAFPHSIQYGTINQESAVLKAAVLNYSATEEKRRFFPFIDPLDF